jgi:hypothetical protein
MACILWRVASLKAFFDTSKIVGSACCTSSSSHINTSCVMLHRSSPFVPGDVHGAFPEHQPQVDRGLAEDEASRRSRPC